MDNLKPCPFCGSEKLKIEKKSVLDGYNGLEERVERHTYSVRCNVCHARGPAFGGRVVLKVIGHRFMALPTWGATDEALKKSAVDAWNNRGEEKHGQRADSH